MASQFRPRGMRILIAGLTSAVLSLSLLGFPAHSRGAGAGTQPSLNVAVVPGFAPKTYPGYYGIPALPVGASQLSAYHFSQLPVSGITLTALQSYDTVILYGIRWSDIPATEQAAINTFAATHKVLIWDADDTGSQNYATFIQPFSDVASGENYPNKPNDSVVSYPSGVNFLASDNPSSPYYLDPNQLVKDKDEINDMNAMTTGTTNWVPALFAANQSIPHGGWPIAWSYGVIGNHTGLTIYSGIDADAFGNTSLNPNYAIKELALQLAAPFRQTPDSSCAPGCHLPSAGGGSGSGGGGSGSGGGGGSGGGSGSGGSTYASCSFAKPLPRHWVHGRVVVALKTSVAAGIVGRVVTSSGRILASRNERGGSVIRLVVHTRKLHSNRVARLRALVLVNGQQACRKPFRLKVDNTRPRLLFLATTRAAGRDLVQLSVSESVAMSIAGKHVPHRHSVLIDGHRKITVHLPASVSSARLILRDRAGNTLVRKLRW